MAVQLTDEIVVSRSLGGLSLNGRATVEDVIGLFNPLRSDGSLYQTNAMAIFRAWPLRDGTGYEATSYSKVTGQIVGNASGALPVPDDITILTYS